MKTKTMVLKPPTRKLFWLDRESASEIANLCNVDGFSVEVSLRNACLEIYSSGIFYRKIEFQTWVYLDEGILWGVPLRKFDDYNNEWEECE